jgi:hypothetical protein
MEDITKEWTAELLVLVGDVELSDPNLIGSPVVTQTEYDGPCSARKNKKKEEVEDIDNEEKENALE